MAWNPRIRPAMWPVVAAASPVLAPGLALRYRRFGENVARATAANRQRIAAARPLPLPVLDFLELTVLVEAKGEPGFKTASGVSYLVRTDRGSLLFDVGFGETDGVLAANLAALGIDAAGVDEVVISHLHLDHMGGRAASTSKTVMAPAALKIPADRPCYVPDRASAPGMTPVVLSGPRVLRSGVASTGPLARAMFFLGYCEEQSLVAHVKGKGLVVITGCGHPRIEKILALTARLAAEPLYAVVGGLHFPMTASRSRFAGLPAQQFFGTGKPPWRRLDERDLDAAMTAIKAAGPHTAWLSAHDSCDWALGRFEADLGVAEFAVLRAGATYRV